MWYNTIRTDKLKYTASMDIHSQLSLFGLNENERIVYLYVHSSGQSTVLQITKATGIKRTTVYRVSEALKAKGFLYEFDENDSKQLTVTPLSILEEKIKRKEMRIIKMKSALAPVLHTLSKTTSNSKDDIQTYKDILGVNKVIEYLINDIATEELSIFSYNFSIFPPLDFNLIENFWTHCDTTKAVINHHIKEETPIAWTNTNITQGNNYKVIKSIKIPEKLKTSTIIVRNNETLVFDWTNQMITAQIIKIPVLSRFITEMYC